MFNSVIPSCLNFQCGVPTHRVQVWNNRHSKIRLMHWRGFESTEETFYPMKDPKVLLTYFLYTYLSQMVYHGPYIVLKLVVIVTDHNNLSDSVDIRNVT